MDDNNDKATIFTGQKTNHRIQPSMKVHSIPYIGNGFIGFLHTYYVWPSEIEL